MTEKSKKDKNQNIQVFVRLRPLNQRERDIKSLGVVEVVNNREVVVRQSQQTSLTKKFTFDRAFGPYAKQVEVYQEVVSPLIEEVLAGYNCTVFAYGQTGTGKTHTMVGESCGTDTTWQNDPMAGIIPRALSQLFDELRLSNTEYTVRVSYLELYNEELFDLLSSSEDNSKLRIYEDVTRKGSNIVNGLEEITVYNKNEVYKIMSQGQERKRVASTLMNAQSSRSHTVFTIVVHMKENSAEGEELVKIGKLNLVDLAGSENISKAGSDNPAKRERARECVNINQSLLTLGRVITALVERHPHIPYRESKLTRILQESLGGRTKTSIIATVSPGHKDLEETMSTLEYAHRAKNIQNKPEINQKMTKKAILKEYAEEIDRLKRDLQAARDKNGVYLANETFAEITLKQEEQRKEIQELLLKKRDLEEERDRMELVFAELDQQLKQRDRELHSVKGKLKTTADSLNNTTNILKTTQLHYEEQKHLVSKREDTERALSEQARAILATADRATADLTHLHDAVDKRRSVESTNLEITKSYQEHSTQHREQITNDVKDFADNLKHALSGLQDALENHFTISTETLEQNKLRIEALIQKIINMTNEISESSSQSRTQIESSATSCSDQLRAMLQEHSNCVQQMLAEFVQSAAVSVEEARRVDSTGRVQTHVQKWYAGSSERVSWVRRAHAAFVTRVQHAAGARAAAAADRAHARRARLHAHVIQLTAFIEEIEKEKVVLEERLSKQLADIEQERVESEARLAARVEDERRAFEERMARWVADETSALRDAAAARVARVQHEKALLKENIAKHIKWQQQQLQASKEELEQIEEEVEECKNGREERSRHIHEYGKEFDEGANAISVDLEVFSRNIVELVGHVNEELIRIMEQAKEQIETEVNNAIAKEREDKTMLINNCDATLRDVVRTSVGTVDILLDKVKCNGGSTNEELSRISESTRSVVEQSAVARSAHTSCVAQMRMGVQRIEAGVGETLAAHAHLEGRYLRRDYRLYSPTGKTPVRQVYKYPRTLAATSPHERILARFRTAQLNNLNNEDCVVIESDTEEVRASDSESTMSEDSPVAFAAPSPPLSVQSSQPAFLPPPSARNAIIKCTSESDIYVISKNEHSLGKENADRSIQYRKPSKLPAPTSNKKPLVTSSSANQLT